MEFTLYGRIEERPIRLTWADGKLTGDPETLDELRALADVLEGQPVGPEPDGPFTTRKHLHNPLTAQILMQDVLDEVTGADGRLPQPLPRTRSVA